jgi:hypothetical protein
MHTLKIAIDPALKDRWGPEIAWTWRLVLSGIGYAWHEVAPDDPGCDIAYVARPELVSHARLCVRADPNKWERRASLRLEAVSHADGWSYPLYRDELAGAQLLQREGGRAVCHRDLLFDVFWLVSGQEEAHWPKNVHGYADLGGSAYQRETALRLGLASGIGASLEAALGELGLPAPTPRWPHGKRAAAAAGHDVDYPEVIRWLEPLRILRRQGLPGISNAAAVAAGRRTHWHFASWVRMEQQLNTRSAFYFVARRGSLREYATGTPDPFYDVQSRRFRELFRYLAAEGFEIGMHASYRACESRERFAAEKQALEAASGQPVVGNRHHYWHLDPVDPEATLLMHEQIGLKYDTSLFHDRYIGWRRGTNWPFFPFLQRERRQLKILQVPTGWMDDQLFGQRVDNPGDRQGILRALADRAAAQGGCLLIDIHDYVFDDALFPGWARAYRELWEYLATRSDFWFDTPGRIADHWIARYQAIERASQGLVEGNDHGARTLVRPGLLQPAVPEEIPA